MKVKLTMILELLTDCQYKYFLAPDNRQYEFGAVRLLTKNVKEYRSDVLYLGLSDTLNQLSNLPKTVICLETEAAPLKSEKFSKIELALIREAGDILTMFERIEDIFSDYAGIYEKMIRKVIDNRGLEVMINAMTLILGNPFYVADSDFKVIGRTSCSLNKLDEWQFIISNGIEDGYISSSINDFYYMKDLLKKTENQDEAVFFSGNELYPHSFYSMSLKSQNQKIGIVTVFQTERPFSIGTKAILEFFSEIIIIELLKNQRIKSNEGVRLGNIFTEILSGDKNAETELHKVMQFMDIDFPQKFYLMTIKSENDNRNRYELTFLRKAITRMIPNTICIIYQNTIVILTDEKNYLYWTQSESVLFKWLKEKRLIVGISEVEREIFKIKNAHQQTLFALEIGSKAKGETPVFCYQQLRFSHLIHLVGNLENWESLVHPGLKKLKEYDQEKGADLSETLYVFMKSGRSQAKTAKILHVHRSSLQYRLAKIESLLGNSLDDYQSFLHLQLSFEIEKYAMLLERRGDLMS